MKLALATSQRGKRSRQCHTWVHIHSIHTCIRLCGKRNPCRRRAAPPGCAGHWCFAGARWPRPLRRHKHRTAVAAAAAAKLQSCLSRLRARHVGAPSGRQSKAGPQQCRVQSAECREAQKPRRLGARVRDRMKHAQKQKRRRAHLASDAAEKRSGAGCRVPTGDGDGEWSARAPARLKIGALRPHGRPGGPHQHRQCPLPRPSRDETGSGTRPFSAALLLLRREDGPGCALPLVPDEPLIRTLVAGAVMLLAPPLTSSALCPSPTPAHVVASSLSYPASSTSSSIIRSS